MKMQDLDGATPLDPNEKEGLIPSVSTQADLNELERANIATGYRWAQKSRKLKRELLSVSGLLLLHRQLLGEVWSWAGKIRQTEKNIGVSPVQIQPQLQCMLDNVRFWIEHEEFSWQEIAIRFHHEMVRIHSFANGNGRHARIAANLLLYYQGEKPCTWGDGDLLVDEKFRLAYIAALRKADQNDYRDLTSLCR